MYLGIDLGTSSVKCVLMTQEQTIVASRSAALQVSRPHDAWSEQQPAHWISAIEKSLDEIKLEYSDQLASVRGIGLSGHMHGATLLDENDEVLRPCMLWNDTRSQQQATQLDTAQSRSINGNILFPGFTSPKVAWVAEHEPQVFERIAKVLLPKDFVRLWLTGEHAADMSDASGTGWLDVGHRRWSDELLAASRLSQTHMPHLLEGTDVSGTLRSALAQRYGMRNSVVVAGGAGDNAASACGMGTVAHADAFLSLGTSGVLFASTGNFQPNAESAVHAFCHAIPDTWHQMGVILAATDALNWLASVTQSTPAQLTQALESTTPTPTEVLFLPYLGGERTPINDSKARGVFIGLNHSTDLTAMTQAVLQGVSFAFRDSQLALATAGTTLKSAAAIGGGAKSTYWLQMLANTLNIPLDVTADGDYGASLGAARLAMIAAEGEDPISICTAPQITHSVKPDGSFDDFALQHSRYTEAYNAIKPLMI